MLVGLRGVLLVGALLQQQGGFFPDRIGEWGQKVDTAVDRAYAVSPARAHAFNVRLVKLAEALHAAPMFQPPRGIQARFAMRWLFPGQCEPGTDCRYRPVRAIGDLRLYWFFADADGQPTWGGDERTGPMIYVNDLSETFRSNTYDVSYHPFLLLPDGRRIRTRPLPTGRAGPFTTYDSLVTVITRPGRPSPWLPVTREQYLRAWMRLMREQMDTASARFAASEDPYTRWLRDRDARRRALEEAYQRIRKTSPAQAEEYRRKSLEMEEKMGAALKKSAPMLAPNADAVELYRSLIARLEAQLAALPAAERATPGWVTPQKEADYWPPLSPAGVGKALVTTNPDYFDRSLPPTDWQIIAFHTTFPGPALLPAIGQQRQVEFLATTDWQRVGALLSGDAAPTPPAR